LFVWVVFPLPQPHAQKPSVGPGKVVVHTAFGGDILGYDSVPVSPCVHSAASWNSHKDQMVWGGLRFDETPLSVVEDAFPELRDND
jgi:hypothetical protein